MANLSEYQRIKLLVETKQRVFDRAQGSYDSTLNRICEEFKVSSVEEATTLLADLTTKEDKAQVAFDSAIAAFKKKYPDVA